ncbi:probable leucine-rich repeat receptor-like protein kinase At1g68400 [Typha latifolia]|uniref:probable leucine-rich repeat receptor-like protein kinase At1g68400 n=1 Tax=Typha latifolia TaxID=4733 RepID=UPI003C2B3394
MTPFAFLIFVVLFSTTSLCSPSPNLAASILLSFKSTASDPGNALSTWTPQSDPCSTAWRGVTCRENHVTRVVLEGLRLAGRFGSLAGLRRLSVLSLKNNSFAVAPLNLSPHIKLLYLSHNRLSGRFPAGILRLRRLRRLDLAGNLLSGGIPPDIGIRLPNLLTLRLEGNLLAGAIPISIAAISGLIDLNVSSNRLEGEVPMRFTSFDPSSFAANPGLCGRPIARSCPNRTAKRKYAEAAIAGAASISSAAAAIAAVLCFKRRIVRRKKQGGTLEVEKKTNPIRRTGEGKAVVFEGCAEFEMEELMKGSAEMLGRGAVGSTYRVMMEGGGEEEWVVVKRVKRERRRKEGVMETALLKEMGEWRHPNVVSLRGYYSGQDELLLLYDYVPNGSLHDLLHGNRGPGRIPVEWSTRVKLAVDAAKGLAYLHNASKSKHYSHHHLASSNILIDAHGNACISDFSLLPLLSPPSLKQDNQMHDVYNFGIILLEILTGKSSEDGKEDLPKWVQTLRVREDWTSEVFDMEMLGGGKEVEDEMVALLQVSLLCVAHEPKDRPRMAVVYKMVEDIRERGSRSGGSQSFESSSSLSEDATACEIKFIKRC